MVEKKQNNYEFKTEVSQLLKLMINSLYSNKEIFLRELVSNASDALDKLRFLAAQDAAIYGDDSELKIKISFDEKQKTLTLEDNGIGMDKDEIIANIGTIANSGTKKFLEKLTGDKAKDAALIGQFGVGFYSCFMVATKVELLTKKVASDKAYLWESAGEDSYNLAEAKKDTRGTRITIHLKKDSEEYANNARIKNIISTYSDHVAFPILMQEEIEVADDAKTGDDKAEGEKTGDDSKKTKTTTQWTQINKATALWTLPKSQIKDEDYKELYKIISHDYRDPLTYIHNKVEGTLEYISLLYIPEHPSFDLWDRNQQYGLKLYVNRVFIMDNARDLLPTYLRFIKGLIDSSDLPLNVSREILQTNQQITKIKTATIKKVLDFLEALSTSDKKEDKEKYSVFIKNFGKVLKEGIVEDSSNKEKIAKLLRFNDLNSKSDELNISLDEYIKSMNPNQEKIYYLTANSYLQAKNSPYLEFFKKHKLNVLLLTDPVDEWVVGHLNEYNGKPLESVSTSDVKEIEAKLSGKVEDKKDADASVETSDADKIVLNKIKKALGERVKDVTATDRLVNSASCIQNDGMSAQMAQIMAQMGQAAPKMAPSLEVNLAHSFVKKIANLNEDKDQEGIKRWSNLLLDQALLSETGSIDNPSEFIDNINKLLS